MKVIYKATVYDKINNEILEAKSKGLDIAEIHLSSAEFSSFKEHAPAQEWDYYTIQEWDDLYKPLLLRRCIWIRCPKE